MSNAKTYFLDRNIISHGEKLDRWTPVEEWSKHYENCKKYLVERIEDKEILEARNSVEELKASIKELQSKVETLEKANKELEDDNHELAKQLAKVEETDKDTKKGKNSK